MKYAERLRPNATIIQIDLRTALGVLGLRCRFGITN
jgi:hypothetical protein